jgi:nucleoside-diphosphate-sugar epimerase
MIPSLILQLLRGERPRVTAGQQKWDYVYVADAAEAVARVALNAAAAGVFNLGSGEAPVLRTIVESIRDEIDPRLPIGFGEVPYRSDQVMHLQAVITRLQTATGWAPRTPLADGLARTIAWYRQHLASVPEAPEDLVPLALGRQHHA